MGPKRCLCEPQVVPWTDSRTCCARPWPILRACGCAELCLEWKVSLVRCSQLTDCSDLWCTQVPTANLLNVTQWQQWGCLTGRQMSESFQAPSDPSSCPSAAPHSPVGVLGFHPILPLTTQPYFKHELRVTPGGHFCSCRTLTNDILWSQPRLPAGQGCLPRSVPGHPVGLTFFGPHQKGLLSLQQKAKDRKTYDSSRVPQTLRIQP